VSHKIRNTIIIGVAIGTDGYLQITGLTLIGCRAFQQSRVYHQPGNEIFRLVQNGVQPGLILVCGISFGCRTLVDWVTVSCIVFTGHSITHRLAGHVLDQEPGREQEREVDDAKQKHQEDGKSESELNHALRAAGIPPEAFPGNREGRVSGSHFHHP
jgi:hypothetical protein